MSLHLTRAECATWELPCALTQCRHHLANTSGKTPPEETMTRYRGCALNVADAGPRGPREIAKILGVTTTAVCYTMRDALIRLARRAETTEAREIAAELVHPTEPVYPEDPMPDNYKALRRAIGCRPLRTT